MRTSFGNPSVVASELQGQFVPGRDTIVPPPKFAIVARALWPQKTAAHLATIAGKDERTAKRWLAGEYEPPVIVITAILVEMFKRE
jgi:hypothetical protein